MNAYLQHPVEASVAHYAFDRGERVFRQWNTSVIQIGRMCAIAPVAEVAVALQVFLAVSFLSRHTIVYRSTLLCVFVWAGGCGRMDWSVGWWMGEWENERARDDCWLLSTPRVIAAALRELEGTSRRHRPTSANSARKRPYMYLYTVPAVSDDDNSFEIKLSCLQHCGHYRLSSIF
jgi:hypothetical protein